MSDRSSPIPITIDKRTLDASVNAVAKLTDQVLDLEERLRTVERQRDDYASQLVMLQMDRDDWQARAGKALDDMQAAEQRMLCVLDGSFSVGDGTAQREIERLRDVAEAAEDYVDAGCATEETDVALNLQIAVHELRKARDPGQAPSPFPAGHEPGHSPPAAPVSDPPATNDEGRKS
jgi:tellurite resistance protein